MQVLRRLADFATTAVIALAVFVVGHNLAFLLQDGAAYGADIARTGDGRNWDDTVRIVLAASGLLAAVAIWRLAYLRRLGHRLDPGFTIRQLPGTSYIRDVAGIWPRLLTASLVLFVLQENLERWSASMPLPGLGVLEPTSPIGPIPVFVLVSLVFALVVALFRVGIETLEELIAEARARMRLRSSRQLQYHRSDSLPRLNSIQGRHLAGRAPPSPLPL